MFTNCWWFVGSSICVAIIFALHVVPFFTADHRFAEQFPYAFGTLFIFFWTCLQTSIGLLPPIYHRFSRFPWSVPSISFASIVFLVALLASRSHPKTFIFLTTTVPVGFISVLWILIASAPKNQMLLIISTLATLFSAELTFRHFLVTERIPSTQEQFSDSIARHWQEAVPIEKTPGNFRIVGLSDSFGVAGGSQNYHYLLPDLLRPTNVEIVNMSLGDFQPDQEVELFRRFGPTYRPDLVLYGFYVGNDFIHVEGRQVSYNGFNLRIQDGFDTYIFPNWTLLQWLAKQLKASYHDAKSKWRQPPTSQASEEVSMGIKPEDSLKTSPQPEPVFEKTVFLTIMNGLLQICCAQEKSTDAFEPTLKWIDELTALTQTLDADFVMVIHPAQFQVETKLYQQILKQFGKSRDEFDLDKPQKVLQDYCQSRQISCLDLLPTFRKNGSEGGLYALQETHYNNAGNQLAATTIVEHLTSRQPTN